MPAQTPPPETRRLFQQADTGQLGWIAYNAYTKNYRVGDRELSLKDVEAEFGLRLIPNRLFYNKRNHEYIWLPFRAGKASALLGRRWMTLSDLEKLEFQDATKPELLGHLTAPGFATGAGVPKEFKNKFPARRRASKK